MQFQELHCHSCDQYVQFMIDDKLDGNHVLNCPNCGHQHYRIVKDGQISDDRWFTHNNLPTYYIDNATSSPNSTWDCYNSSSSTDLRYFTYNAWMNATQTV